MANGLFIPSFRGPGSPGASPVGSIAQGLQLEESGRLELQGERDAARMDSLVQGAIQLKNISDPRRKLAFLKNRRDELVRSGISTEDTDEAIELAQAGRFDELSEITDQAISLGKQNIKGDFSKGVQLTGKRNGKDVLITSSFNKQTGQVELVESVISGQQAAQGDVIDVGEIGNTPAEQVVSSTQGGAGAETQGDQPELLQRFLSGLSPEKQAEFLSMPQFQRTGGQPQEAPADSAQQDEPFQFTSKNTGLTAQEESDIAVEESRKKERAKLEEKFNLSPDIAGAVKTAEREAEAETQGKVAFAKEQAKWNAGRSKIKGKIATAARKQEVIKVTGEKIKSLMTKWNTGFGSSLKLLPAAEARTLASLIDTMRANTAFATLREIKDTGGTLGAVSAPELKLLESAYGQIDQAGEIPEQIRVINQIMGATQGSIDQMEKGFGENEEFFGGDFKTAEAFLKASRNAEEANLKKKRLEELRAKQGSAQ